ncbi:MAG: zinc-dependent alcohol dehydrogenase family protein [bacterium]
MKSAVYYGKENIKLENLNKAELKHDEVMINVKACGVCGTDVHIYHGSKGSADVTKPTVLGHEFSGVITEVGSSIVNFKVGDRVCVDPNCYCGKCTPCRNGLTHYCENMVIYGITEDGGFKEYCAVNEKAVYKLGDDTSFNEGAMVEPLGCCIHGIDMCNIKHGDNVAIIGGGMIGLIMLQLAKLSGAAKIVLLEPVDSKCKIALDMGASLCIDPINSNVKEVLSNNNIQVNKVIECVGKTKTIELAIDICGNKGLVMMFGLTAPDDTIEIKPFEIFKKELIITSSFINPCTQQRALDLIDNKKIDVSSMIYDIISLKELEDVLKDPSKRSLGKFLVDPSK